MKKYANRYGYTDVEPYEITRVISDKTIEIRRMNAELAEGYKPEFIPGGFSAHCTNNRSLEYNYTSNEDNPVIRARLRKDGKFHSKGGRHILEDEPYKYYDYNF